MVHAWMGKQRMGHAWMGEIFMPTEHGGALGAYMDHGGGGRGGGGSNEESRKRRGIHLAMFADAPLRMKIAGGSHSSSTLDCTVE